MGSVPGRPRVEARRRAGDDGSTLDGIDKEWLSSQLEAAELYAVENVSPPLLSADAATRKILGLALVHYHGGWEGPLQPWSHEARWIVL